MSAKINSNPLNIDSHALYQSVPVQITDAGALINQGNWEAQSTNISLVVPILNVLGGILGTCYGLRLSKQGVDETRRAMQCNDRQGMRNGLANTGIGVAFTGMSVGVSANGVIGALPKFGSITTQQSQCLINIFTQAINWMGVILYAFYVVVAAVSLPELGTFRSAWNAMLDTPKINSQTKALESLRFLQDKIFLTDQEKLELSGKPSLDTLKKQQQKASALIRCVGFECAQKIEKELPRLFQEVAAGNLANTQALLALVNKGNFKQIVKQVALLAAGIIGGVGSTLALLAIGGYASFAFIAVSSTLYWLNDMIGEMAYKVLAPSTDMIRVCYKPTHALV